jgi:hypothetical protein
MRPGLRAKVTVVVAREPSALQAPVQSIVEHEGLSYCLAKDDAGGWTPKLVETGPNNDKFVVISTGLAEGEQIALDAQRYAESVTFPQAPEGVKIAKRQTDEPRGKRGGKRRPQADSGG